MLQERLGQVAFEEFHALRQTVGCEVPRSEVQCGVRDVGSVDARAGQFFGKSDRDAAGACADIGNHWGRIMSDNLQRLLDDDFRLRPRDERARIAQDFQRPEFRVADDVLDRFARGAPCEQRVVPRRFIRGEPVLGASQERAPVAFEEVRHQHFGAQAGRLHAGPAGVYPLGAGRGHEIGVVIHEGKNRQVRRMFEVLGYEVQKLDRVAYGPVTKEGLGRGETRSLTRAEIRSLRKLAGMETEPRAGYNLQSRVER